MNIFEINATQILESNIYFQQISSLVGRTYIDLFMFTIGLFFYALFVFNFYKRLSKRDLFSLDLQKYSSAKIKWRRLQIFGSALAYVLEYLIIFPLYVSFWFTALSLFLSVLAKEVTVNQIIFISAILISTVRLASYYNEELANDLAKLLPFTLLAILLFDPTFFKLELVYTRIMEMPKLINIVIQFLIFTIVFEWILRIVYSIKRKVSG